MPKKEDPATEPGVIWQKGAKKNKDAFVIDLNDPKITGGSMHWLKQHRIRTGKERAPAKETK